MNVLITGITGFLGSHLALHLSHKHKIIGITSNTNTNSFNNTIELYTIERIAKINHKPDVIILCHAAVSSGNIEQDEQTLHQANIKFTGKILDAFKNVKCVYISSVSVYKQTDTVIDELSETQPTSSYAISKLNAEELVLNNRSNCCIIRFSSLYGPQMKPHTLIPKYVTQALTKKNIEVWGTGQRKQNYIHVTDAAKLIEKTIEQKELNQDIFLGTFTSEYANFEVAEIIKNITGAKIIYCHDDNSESVTYNNYNTKKTLNWEPQLNFKEGIKAYIQWKTKQF
jgi:UDP-glucose 4-epimerase